MTLNFDIETDGDKLYMHNNFFELTVDLQEVDPQILEKVAGILNDFYAMG